MKYARFCVLALCALCFGLLGAEAEQALAPLVGIPNTAAPDWLIFFAHIAEALLPILAVPIALIAGWGVKKLSAKFHLDGIINTQAIVDDAVAKGVAYAEQWAANAASKPPSGDKMKMAVAFADSILQSKNVIAYETEHLEKIAEGLISAQNAAPPAPTPGA